MNGKEQKICDNGWVPRFVENPTSGELEVIYSTSIQCPAEPAPVWFSSAQPQSNCTKTGKVAKRTIIGGTSVQPEVNVYTGGSYYGGISYDNRYLCTAWPAGMGSFMLDLQSAAAGPKVMHVLPVKNKTTLVDSIWGLGCCNPSRSPSRVFTDAMMYFDFGLSTSTTKYAHGLWGSWGLHATFFITRMGSGTYGQQIRIYGLPTDQVIVSPKGQGEAIEMQWINPEWSNHPYFSTAALMVDRVFPRPPNSPWPHKTNNEAIYAINLLTSSGHRLVESTDISGTSTTTVLNPYLWVKIAPNFQEDPTWLATQSAGIPQVPIAQPIHVAERRTRPRTVIPHTTLMPAHQASRVTILSGRGEVVWQSNVSAAGDGRIALPAVRPGVYFVKVWSAKEAAELVRWVVR